MGKNLITYSLISQTFLLIQVTGIYAVYTIPFPPTDDVSSLISGSGTVNINLTLSIAGGQLGTSSCDVMLSSASCCRGYCLAEEACILVRSVWAALTTRRRRSSRMTKSTLRTNLYSLVRTERHRAIWIYVIFTAEIRNILKLKWERLRVARHNTTWRIETCVIITSPEGPGSTLIHCNNPVCLSITLWKIYS